MYKMSDPLIWKMLEIYMIKVALSVRMYPSSAYSFSPIGMKLGMDSPWDPAGDMGYIRLRFAIRAMREARNRSKG